MLGDKTLPACWSSILNHPLQSILGEYAMNAAAKMDFRTGLQAPVILSFQVGDTVARRCYFPGNPTQNPTLNDLDSKTYKFNQA